MQEEREFHTQKGYEMASANKLTSAAEDYLEMIYRLSGETGFTRVNLLAQSLNVKPSSASKMVDHLREMGLAIAEKYSCITLTVQGHNLGEYLIYRHELINRLLCLINHSTDELEQAERIEHFFDERTVYNLDHFLNKIV